MISPIRKYSVIILAILLIFIAQTVSAASVSDSQVKSLIKWQSENDWDSDNRKTDGRTIFGFTHQRHKDGSLPRWDHWCKLLDQGRATYDKEPFDYWFWYEVRVDVGLDWEQNGMEWLQKKADSLRNARFVDIGDKAITNDSECCVIKGPIRINAYIGLNFDNGDYLYCNDGVQWAIPYWPVPEKDQITAKKDKFLNQRTDVMLELVRNILASADGKSTPSPEKPVQKPAVQQPKSAPGLTLTASPAALWADGKSTSKLKLIAYDANGNPIKGTFDINVTAGKCSNIKLITDAAGVATATYTAPAEPGEDTVTVVGPDGEKTSIAIRLGGLKVIPVDASQSALFADGKTKTDLIVMCGDPNFKPLAGTKVKLFVNEKDLPVKGTLSAESVVIGSDGRAGFTYIAPDVYSAKSNFSRGNVYIAAIASLGNPARQIKAVYRIPVYAGNVYYLNVEKAGFQPVEKFSIPAPSKNGILAGTVIHDSFPIANAILTLADAQGKPIGKCSSDGEGKFQLEFVGDVMNSTGQSMEMNEPIKMALDEDLTRMMSAWKSDLDILEKSPYDVDSMKEFAADLPKNLAASISGSKTPLNSSEYLFYNAVKLAWTCRYIKLLNERQMESVDWFLESAKNIISTVADFTGVSDKLEAAAKGKLKDKFRPETWKKFEDSMLREFSGLFYKQVQKSIDVARTLNYDTSDLESLQKSGANYATKLGVNGISDALKSGFKGVVHKSTQKILAQAGGSALRGELDSEDPTDVLTAAKEAFTEYEKQHNALNMSNVDIELYRLDAKLFTDTVIKGPFIYLKLKKLVMDPDTIEKIAELDTATLEKLQEEFIGSGDTVSKVFSALDAPFQAYQGYNWLADFCNAGTVKGKIAEALSD